MTRLRWFGVLVSLLMLAFGPGTASGANGTYTLVQCDPLNRGSDEAELEPTVAYSVRRFCGDAEHDFSLRIENVVKTQAGRSGTISWKAPGGTSIVGLTAESQLHNENGHRARVYIADDEGREVRRVANGSTAPSPWKDIGYEAQGGGHEQLIIKLSCENDQGCDVSGKARALIRNVRIKLRDENDPVLDRVSGSLFDGGWLRGEKTVDASVADLESGLTTLRVLTDQGTISTTKAACPGQLRVVPPLASVPHPCTEGMRETPVLDTTTTPFHDGVNQVSICASDFATNASCARRLVRIDNSGPELAFEDHQNPQDPELIEAYVSDSASGVANGEILFRRQASGDAGFWQSLPTSLVDERLLARVDSSSQSPGAYEFLARATDVAGNTSETRMTVGGQSKVLKFPLRSGVQLLAKLEPGGSKEKTIAYGDSAVAAGRLLSASGAPLAHEKVTVVEHFGQGALIAKRKRSVRTDGHGNWSERLPPGPSRRVTTSFAGNERYVSLDRSAGRLAVRSRATFKTSRHALREGKRIVFSGRVGHLGAHIPPGGKLVEVQVRERPGRWNTVREALYTNGGGQYRMSYRFGRFYVQDAKFRFRVKVTREQGWPYKAPVHSRGRMVIVKAHK